MVPPDAGLTEPPYAAVVVNYEAGDALTRCVASILADTPIGQPPPPVVVVDNGSTDGSVARLLAVHPQVALVDPGANLGYAAAANRGLAATSAPVVLVANPDLELQPGTTAAVLHVFAEPDVAAVGPRLMNPDGTTYPSARRLPSVREAVAHAALGAWWPRNPWTRRYRGLDADPDRRRDVDWVSGAAVWLRRSALEQVGGWDETFFMYGEDLDLCDRLRRAGWRVVYEPAGRVVHAGGASTRRRPYRMIVEHHRSTYRFAAKRWRGPARALLVPTACFLGARAAMAVAVEALRRRRRARRSRAQGTG